jgi:hypothetical protein
MRRKRALAVLVLPAIGAVTTACPGPKPPPTIQCPPSEMRTMEDCSLAFNLDSQNIQGTVGAFNFLSANASTSTSAIRQVNDQLMGYAIKRQELCKQWNACIIDPTTYRQIGDKMEAVIKTASDQRPAAEQAAKNGDAQAGQAALGAIQSQMSFALEFTAYALFPKDMSKVPEKPCPPDIQDSQRYELQAPRVIAAGDRLPTGTHVTFQFASTAPVYVYLLQRTGATKQLVSLFPHAAGRDGQNDPGIPIPNPIPARQWVQIPAQGQDFCLDQNDLGMDRMFIIASINKLDSLDAAIQQIDSGQAGTIDKSNAALQAIDALPTTPDQLPENCVNSRGFVLDDHAQAPPPGAPQACPPRSRGFVLDSHGSNPASPTSFSAMSDPGANAMLVKVFPYDHADKNASTESGPRKRDIMIEQ